MKAKLAIAACLMLLAFGLTSNVISQVALEGQPYVRRIVTPLVSEVGETVKVSLQVVVEGAGYYAIDETLPVGWEIVDAGSGSTEQRGHIKWVVISGAVDTAYNYSVRPATTGTFSFSGECMFNGDAEAKAIVGDSNVFVKGDGPVVDGDRIVSETYYYRENGGIFIDTADKNSISIAALPVRVKWGYDVENEVTSDTTGYSNFFLQHDLPVQPDPCGTNPSLEFVTDIPYNESCSTNCTDFNSDGCFSWERTCVDVKPDGVQIFWDYNLTKTPSYGFREATAHCLTVGREICDEEMVCGFFENECEVSLGEWVSCNSFNREGECVYLERFFTGEYYDIITKSKWVSVGDLASCPLQQGRLYRFRHVVPVGAGRTVNFDVNAVFSLPVLGSFVFTIPEPTVTSTLQSDFTSDSGMAGNDFNHTKVTSDGNVMPTGELYIPDRYQPGGGLVGYWKLDANNATVAADSSGYGNNGTWLNGADSNGSWFFDRNAGFFDRVDDYVDLGDVEAFDGLSAISVSAWFNPDIVADEIIYTIVSKWDAGSVDTANFRIILQYSASSTYITWHLYDSGGTSRQVASGWVAARAGWQQLVGVYDGSFLHLYWDGVEIGTPTAMTGNILSSNANARIGADSDGDLRFKGTIAEAKIFNRALNETEIANEYRRNLDGNGLVAYYSFNDTNSSGNGVEDRAGNDQNGLLVNGADTNAAGMWDTNAGFFDGANDYIASHTMPVTSYPFTLSAWCRLKQDIDATGVSVSLADTSDWGTYYWIGCYTNGTYMRADLQVRSNGGTSQTIASSPYGYPWNGWHQVVGIFENDTSRHVYLDGTYVASNTGEVAFDTDVDRITIGVIGDSSPSYYMNGQIDEVKIYNRALTAEEIAADYNAWMTDAVYYSPIFDGGATVSWDTIQWLEDSDVNNSLTVQCRGCDNNSCSGGQWVDTFSGEDTAHSLTVDNNRYFQYRAILDTNSADWNPSRASATDYGSYARINNVQIEYSSIAVGDSCTCPASGWWEIINGDQCKLEALCDLVSGGLHVANGALEIASSGTLTIPQGYTVLRNKANGKIIRADGGRLVREK